MVVIVTGANGQLGQAIQSIADQYPSIDFVFCSSSELDITSSVSCEAAFTKYKPDFCINTAAYTAVDKAETDVEKARLVNVIGAKNLAESCKQNNTVLLHISTDFVFDGIVATSGSKGYRETDAPNPQGVYGQTKLEGEQAIQAILEKYFIIRTSWVYSQFGANFMKTMLRLAQEKDSISVVNDQIGTPTNAVDLAECLLKIINTQILTPNTQHLFGIYNFSNEGQCSWYEFAVEIFKQYQLSVNVNPIPSSAYPTPAKRPAYSVLDKSKIKTVFEITISNWQKHIKK
ncbi:dTDP-4-dehydrorhamnose reductase [Flavobacterium sp. 20NA77.7]|uniref:dTDP-4-dehydrorhamnose reductase n=1 Tax=Flavobacterium nakdongensis TaxID=3073563 RepID=A0ABY9RB46_9FLAO|nr:dTDP-4-dehydrorhamnose reductase [Flavobacterium sp. 20NA77.7]WMW77874.1 dTDP-4-dehydrorhamnose reductase [Flavobacterium sp. 20NA77.7]